MLFWVDSCKRDFEATAPRLQKPGMQGEALGVTIGTVQTGYILRRELVVSSLFTVTYRGRILGEKSELPSGLPHSRAGSPLKRPD